MTDELAEPQEPNTLRSRLRQRRQEAVSNLYLDRPVPRLDEYVVRFKPLPGGRVEQINKQAEKSRDSERYVNGAAVSLAECCIGIFEVVDDEADATDRTKDGKLLRPLDPGSEEPMRFDKRLAVLLGIEGGAISATQVVRAFYLTDGDVTAESNAVTTWSGFAGTEAAEEFAGN